MIQPNGFKKKSVIIKNNGNIHSIQYHHSYSDTTINPLLTLKSFLFSAYSIFIKHIILYIIKKNDDTHINSINTINEFKNHIDSKILNNKTRYICMRIYPLPYSNMLIRIRKHCKLITIYKHKSTDSSRMFIKIVINGRIIKKIEKLKKSNTQTHSIILLSLDQKYVSNLYLIIPCIDLLYKWYNRYALLHKLSLYKYLNMQKIL